MSSRSFHYDPLWDFDSPFDDAFSSRLYHPYSSSATGTESRNFRPAMDLHEESDGNIVTATFDLPGVKAEEVNVDIANDCLTISGEIKQLAEGRYKVRERSWGRFYRNLMLPTGTETGDIHAKMENGLLNVTFPKVHVQQPQRITVK